MARGSGSVTPKVSSVLVIVNEAPYCWPSVHAVHFITYPRGTGLHSHNIAVVSVVGSTYASSQACIKSYE